jgi:hypothetical protein
MATGDKNDLLVQIANELPDNNAGDINPSNIRTTESALVTYNVNMKETTQQVIDGPIEFTEAPTVGGVPIATGNFLDGVIVVRQASDFGVIDSTKVYWLDGIIDFSGTGLSIEIPATGIYITGYNFDISGIICTDDNYTLFTSPAGGSGSILFNDFFLDISGANSKMYDIVGDTGFEAVEVDKLNFNNCTSLGNIANYRQGLETGTGRFGGTPELTLTGTWVGGYFIDTSIVRSLVAGSYSLYKAGAGFLMSSRFRSNQNIDLPTGVSFLDFSNSNFVNPSTLQLEGCLITRNGVNDASDPLLTPNVTPAEIACAWANNNGLPNTFVGGAISITTEAATVISTPGTFVDLAGTFTPSDLQHFDEPAEGQLRHLGTSPVEFSLAGQFVLESGSNNEVDLKVVIYRAATTSFEDGRTVRRVISNLQGGRDVAYFVLYDNIMLKQNDYVKLQVANVAATNNITAELDSYFTVGAR